MKALVLRDVGKPEHLKNETLDAPGLLSGHCLVKVKSASLNHRDWWIVKGLYANIKTPCILGSDAAGIVHAVFDPEHASWIGREVIINPALNWGDSRLHQGKDFRILGMPDDGTFAEFVIVPVRNLVPKPAHLDWNESAALPLAALTAYRAVFTRGNMLPGQTVLITGIGGGVASIALSMALAAGAVVIVTSGSDAKIGQAVKNGAIAGVNYKDSGFTELLNQTAKKYGGIDIVIDGTGGDTWDALLNAVNPGGTIVTYGATRGKPDSLDLRKVFWKQLTLKGTTMGSPDDFSQMIRFVSQHSIRPKIDSVHALEEYRQAFERMSAAVQNGKIILCIDK